MALHHVWRLSFSDVLTKCYEGINLISLDDWKVCPRIVLHLQTDRRARISGGKLFYYLSQLKRAPESALKELDLLDADTPSDDLDLQYLSDICCKYDLRSLSAIISRPITTVERLAHFLSDTACRPNLDTIRLEFTIHSLDFPIQALWNLVQVKGKKRPIVTKSLHGLVLRPIATIICDYYDDAGTVQHIHQFLLSVVPQFRLTLSPTSLALVSCREPSLFISF